MAQDQRVGLQRLGDLRTIAAKGAFLDGQGAGQQGFGLGDAPKAPESRCANTLTGSSWLAERWRPAFGQLSIDSIIFSPLAFRSA
ncbi:MAG: hypothetical protein V3R22_03470, partial [Kiloniellales bacterium]